MLRPILLVSIVLPVLAGQVTAPLPRTGTTAPVRDVTTAPRIAEIEFVDFEFQQPRAMAHAAVSMYRIDGEPAGGTVYPVEAHIAGEEAIATASFDVIAEGGTKIQPLLIARRGTGVPVYSQFIGMMNVPDRPFRIRLTGESVDGRRFQHIFERLFRPVKGSLERRPYVSLPPEYADLGHLMNEEAARLVADVESYVADNATVPLVMPGIEVSKVMYAPLLSAAGRPIGVRITYDVEFSQDGVYNPRLDVYPENPEASSGVSDSMRILNSSLEPLPRLAHAPHARADTREGASVLAYGAEFLYDARTIYHFMVELVPDFMVTPVGATTPCVWREGFQWASAPGTTFASMLAREGPTTYRINIGDEAFKGRIEKFPGEGTLYRSLVAEGAQDCPPAR